MACEKLKPLVDKGVQFLSFFVIAGVVFFIAGVLFISIKKSEVMKYENCTESQSYEDTKIIMSKEYTECSDFIEDVRCFDQAKKMASCTCIIPFNATRNYDGDILLSYELDMKNLTEQIPELFESRDDVQLSGNLTGPPSNSCSPYDYINATPIAPCGALADYMFTDTFGMTRKEDSVPLFINNDFLSPQLKAGFNNPPGSNLSSAFQNYTKPLHWNKNIWELDEENPNNNGFLNEAFIAWMNKNMKIKPVGKLNRTIPGFEKGFRKGNYLIIVYYNYTLFYGRRSVVLSQVIPGTVSYPCEHLETAVDIPLEFELGIASLVVGLLCFMLAVGLYAANKYYESHAKVAEEADAAVGMINPQDPNHTPTSQNS